MNLNFARAVNPDQAVVEGAFSSWLVPKSLSSSFPALGASRRRDTQRKKKEEEEEESSTIKKEIKSRDLLGTIVLGIEPG